MTQKLGASGGLIVRGEDQLYSYKGPLHYYVTQTISGADGYIQSATPPANEVWHVTNIGSVDVTSPTTRHFYICSYSGTLNQLGKVEGDIPADSTEFWHGHYWLENGDVIRVYFRGGLVGDRVDLHMSGTIMTKET